MSCILTRMTTNPELRVEGKGQERGELTFNTQLSHNCGKATFDFISYQCYNHFYYLSLHEYTSLRRTPHVNSLCLSSILIQCVISSKLLFMSLESWHVKEHFGICYAKIVWLIFEILKIKTLGAIFSVFQKWRLNCSPTELLMYFIESEISNPLTDLNTSKWLRKIQYGASWSENCLVLYP